MNVGELKRILATVADDTLVVIPTRDHAYLEAVAGVFTAVREGKRRISEYHGPEYVEEGMTVIAVFIISAG